MAKKNDGIERATKTADNKHIQVDPYELLINGIIIRAVKDYRKALKTLCKGRKNESALRMKEDCERFFLSDYYYELTDVDGQSMINRLKKECNYHD